MYITPIYSIHYTRIGNFFLCRVGMCYKNVLQHTNIKGKKCNFSTLNLQVFIIYVPEYVIYGYGEQRCQARSFKLIIIHFFFLQEINVEFHCWLSQKIYKSQPCTE